ncbi:MAG TPA: amidase family protein [Meiothermus sp.]|jgi:Asp-tRNA(Asn)/Glu-tRNA(Gln) amidotransferase A subunit family amidase|nr:amidase family protein [Meiothermus sp.]
MTHDPFNAVILPVLHHPHAASGPLAGLTFAAKDLFDVAGLPTRAGNPDFAQRWGIPTRDAWAVRALADAGAKLVAKTHTHELAYGMTGINPHYGTPTNPKAPGHIPGGSSSGSAVAVAAGLVPVALGSDTGGSVRIPASLCGIWAYRPTHGLIPAEGVVPLAPSYDTVGLLAANPEVMEQFARVLLAPRALTPAPFTRALIVQDAADLADAEALRAVQELARCLERLGLAVGEIRLGLLEDSIAAQRVLQGAQAWSVHRDWIETRQPRLGDDVQRLLAMAARFTSAEIGQALIGQARVVSEALPRFTPRTLMLLPATPSAAPRIEDLRDTERALDFRWRTLTLTTLASVLGLPVVTVPDLSGPLPVGTQLIGPGGSDLGLLELAHRLNL